MYDEVVEFVRGLIFFSFGLKVGANLISGPEVVSILTTYVNTQLSGNGYVLLNDF